MHKNTAALMIAFVLVVAVGAAEARVVRIVIEETRPFANGRSFGSAGPFERLDGTVHMEIDPADPLNALIVNVSKAPRNERGLVEFAARFYIIKPVKMASGNRKIFYGINNRGNDLEIPHGSWPPIPQGAPQDETDGLIFRLGYSFVDAGWAGDVDSSAARLGAELPVARESDGSPITSRIRVELTAEGFTVPLKGTSDFRNV